MEILSIVKIMHLIFWKIKMNYL